MCASFGDRIFQLLAEFTSAEWAFSSWGLSGNGSWLFTSRKMRLPLPAVAPPAAPTIFVIQRCQLLTPQSHSLSPLENLPFKLRRAAGKKNVIPKVMRQTLLLFDGGSNVGDFNKHAMWWFGPQVMNSCGEWRQWGSNTKKYPHSISSSRGCKGGGRESATKLYDNLHLPVIIVN